MFINEVVSYIRNQCTTNRKTGGRNEKERFDSPRKGS
jgi:hypothetical protein